MGTIARQNSKILRRNNKILGQRKVGNGLKFDGVNDYVSFAGTASGVAPPSEFVFGLNQNNQHTIILTGIGSQISFPKTEGAKGTNIGHGFYFINGKSLSKGATRISYSIDTTKINEVIYVRDGSSASDISVYVNRRLLPSSEINVLDDNLSGDDIYQLSSGKAGYLSRVTFSYFSATTHHVSCYSKAFTASEVANFDYKIEGKTDVDLWYDFNYRQGNIIHDLSRNGHNGTLSNGFSSTKNYGGIAWVDSAQNNAK